MNTLGFQDTYEVCQMVSVAEGAIVGTYYKIDGDVASAVDSE